MENIHTNYDAGFKKALSLFQNKSLDFVGLHHLGLIQEPLNTEHVEFDVKYSFSDMAFLLSDGTGISMEWEADISRDDLRRFAKYILEFEEQYKTDFTTIIFTTKMTNIQVYESSTMIFRPVIVNLKKIDGEKVLEKIQEQIRGGEEINELELIYVPLMYNESRSVAELLKLVVSMAKKIEMNPEKREKILLISTLVANKFVPEKEFQKILGGKFKIFDFKLRNLSL